MSVDFGVGSAEDRDTPERPRAGDRRVFAHVYDTYAPHLFDYCAGVLRNPAAAANAVQDTLIAADTQIGKLRDYERLPVWLYAIARRQCTSEQASRAEAATADEYDNEYDLSEEYFDSAGFDDDAGFDSAGWAGPDWSRAGLDGAGFDDAESGTGGAKAQGHDIQTLLVVKAALNGLSDRDREVLNLAFRHGVDDAGIAATLGISAGRAHALVSSASTRFEKSAAVVAMLSRGWARCTVLADIAGGTDPAIPRLTPSLLERLTRHIGSCGSCSQNRGYKVFSPDLLGTVPLATPPAALRFRITSTAADAKAESYRRRVVRRIGSLDKDGFPVQSARQRSMTIAMAASSAALVVLIVGGAVLYKHTFASPAHPRATAAAAASGTAPSSSSPSSAAHARRIAHRQALSPFPGGLFGPSPGPAGVPPIPSPSSSGTSPSPKPKHSRSPSPPPTSPPPTSPPPTSPPPTSPPPTSPPPTSPPPTSPPPTTPPASP